jgi:hypothetical protein
LLILLVSGLVAFTLNIAVVMVIGNTSALIFTLAGIVKDLMLVFLSMVIFKSPVSQLQYLGYSVALLGLNLHKEYKKLPAVNAAPTSPVFEDTSSSIADKKSPQV